jgi:polar amino acid transport system substrate-binding protein
MHGVILAWLVVVASACTTLSAGTESNSSTAAIEALAPGGKLRVGLYPGSPTSFIPGTDGTAPRGVGYDLAKELATKAGVAFEPVVFPSNDKVQEAVKASSVDLVFTNATAARAQFIDFTPVVLEIEKGYLVPAGSAIRDGAELDRPGIRIGHSRGSTTQGELAKILKHAQLIPVDSLADAGRALAEGRVDAFASNKAILNQISDGLPGSRVLSGRWGEETFAFGIPKNRPAARPYLDAFVKRARDEGSVRRAAERAGVRGLAAPKSN